MEFLEEAEPADLAADLQSGNTGAVSSMLAMINSDTSEYDSK